ncbi:MAG: VIT1/CCC1 transporter family protein [Thermomicrobiales bacterium]
MDETTVRSVFHTGEGHVESLGDRLNWLRAGVLGANDGLVSVAGVVVGVAGATSTLSTILTAGLAALVAGSLSMAGGEYVSVSTQRETEQAALDREKEELATIPEQEEAELASIYQSRGLSEQLARQVARELTEGNALRAHAEAELRIDPDALTSPWQAAGASFIAFAIGGSLPIVAIILPFEDWRVALCVVAVIVGLVITGYVSARLGGAKSQAAILRNVGVGILTMAITWAVGKLSGSRI